MQDVNSHIAKNAGVALDKLARITSYTPPAVVGAMTFAHTGGSWTTACTPLVGSRSSGCTPLVGSPSSGCTPLVGSPSSGCTPLVGSPS